MGRSGRRLGAQTFNAAPEFRRARRSGSGFRPAPVIANSRQSWVNFPSAEPFRDRGSLVRWSPSLRTAAESMRSAPGQWIACLRQRAREACPEGELSGPGFGPRPTPRRSAAWKRFAVVSSAATPATKRKTRPTGEPVPQAGASRRRAGRTTPPSGRRPGARVLPGPREAVRPGFISSLGCEKIAGVSNGSPAAGRGRRAPGHCCPPKIARLDQGASPGKVRRGEMGIEADGLADWRRRPGCDRPTAGRGRVPCGRPQISGTSAPPPVVPRPPRPTRRGPNTARAIWSRTIQSSGFKAFASTKSGGFLRLTEE